MLHQYKASVIRDGPVFELLGSWQTLVEVFFKSLSWTLPDTILDTRIRWVNLRKMIGLVLIARFSIALYPITKTEKRTLIPTTSAPPYPHLGTAYSVLNQSRHR